MTRESKPPPSDDELSGEEIGLLGASAAVGQAHHEADEATVEPLDPTGPLVRRGLWPAVDGVFFPEPFIVDLEWSDGLPGASSETSEAGPFAPILGLLEEDAPPVEPISALAEPPEDPDRLTQLDMGWTEPTPLDLGEEPGEGAPEVDDEEALEPDGEAAASDAPADVLELDDLLEAPPEPPSEPSPVIDRGVVISGLPPLPEQALEEFEREQTVIDLEPDDLEPVDTEDHEAGPPAPNDSASPPPSADERDDDGPALELSDPQLIEFDPADPRGQARLITIEVEEREVEGEVPYELPAAEDDEEDREVTIEVELQPEDDEEDDEDVELELAEPDILDSGELAVLELDDVGEELPPPDRPGVDVEAAATEAADEGATSASEQPSAAAPTERRPPPPRARRRRTPRPPPPTGETPRRAASAEERARPRPPSAEISARPSAGDAAHKPPPPTGEEPAVKPPDDGSGRRARAADEGARRSSGKLSRMGAPPLPQDATGGVPVAIPPPTSRVSPATPPDPFAPAQEAKEALVMPPLRPPWRRRPTAGAKEVLPQPSANDGPAILEALERGPLEVTRQRQKSTKRSRKPGAWYEVVFDESFPDTLPANLHHRTQREAAFAHNTLRLAEGTRIFDIACGFGRHAIELAKRGYRVLGLDLSEPLIEVARLEGERRKTFTKFVVGDIREISYEGIFDGAIMLGQSFGYFDDRANYDVLRRIRRALRPKGRLLLDLVNRDRVVTELPTVIWWRSREALILEEVEFDAATSRLMSKRTLVFDDGRPPWEQFIEIRLYSLHEIYTLLEMAGFRVYEVSGSIHHPGLFFSKESRQMLILCEAV